MNLENTGEFVKTEKSEGERSFARTQTFAGVLEGSVKLEGFVGAVG